MTKLSYTSPSSTQNCAKRYKKRKILLIVENESSRSLWNLFVFLFPPKSSFCVSFIYFARHRRHLLFEKRAENSSTCKTFHSSLETLNYNRMLLSEPFQAAPSHSIIQMCLLCFGWVYRTLARRSRACFIYVAEEKKRGKRDLHEDWRITQESEREESRKINICLGFRTALNDAISLALASATRWKKKKFFLFKGEASAEVNCGHKSSFRRNRNAKFSFNNKSINYWWFHYERGLGSDSHRLTYS